MAPPPKPSIWCPGFNGGDSLAVGCVGYWPLWDGDGTAAMDLSGRGNHGVLTNSPTWEPSAVGGVIQSTGTNEYVKIGPLTNKSYPNYPLTMACLYRFTSAPANFDNPFCIGGGNAAGLARFEVQSSTIRFKPQWLTENNINTGGGVTVGQWYMVVGVSRADADHEVYLDGVSKATDTTTVGGAKTWDRGAICTRYWKDTGPETAYTPPVQVALAAVWQRALTVGEIAGLTSDPWSLICPRQDWALFSAATQGGAAPTNRRRRVLIAA